MAMLVLLPGMDGTGSLFEPLLSRLPKTCQAKVIHYPTDVHLTYRQLEQYVIERLPAGRPLIVVAESFSGPVALRLAARAQQDIGAVILVCSFAYRPLGSLGLWFARLPLRLIFRLSFPDTIFRAFLLGSSASDQLIGQTKTAIRSVKPNVLAARLRQALTDDSVIGPIPRNVRVIALFATGDRLLGERARRSISESCSHAELRAIAAPHFALQSAPAEVVRALTELGVLDDPLCG